MTRLISYTSRHGASRRSGLILIPRFPLSLLLVYNHRSLLVPIHGYHLQTLLTLPWYTSFPPFFLMPTGFAARDDAHDVMLGLHHNAEV